MNFYTHALITKEAARQVLACLQACHCYLKKKQASPEFTDCKNFGILSGKHVGNNAF